MESGDFKLTQFNVGEPYNKVRTELSEDPSATTYYKVKFRAVSYDPETGNKSKRGMVCETSDIRKFPLYGAGVLKDWDGIGRLEYLVTVYEAGVNNTLENFQSERWQLIALGVNGTHPKK